MTSTWQLQNIGKVPRIKWSQCPSSLIPVLSATFTEYPGTVCWELQLTSQSEVKIISLFSLHSLQWSWIKDLVIGLTISVNREFYFETLFATKKIVFYKSQDKKGRNLSPGQKVVVTRCRNIRKQDHYLFMSASKSNINISGIFQQNVIVTIQVQV